MDARGPPRAQIMSCLGNAIPGCMSAFFIVVLITAIYAILGVEFFSTLDSVVHPGTLEPHGPYYFGDFSSAMFTMFQVMTGESWAEMIARPLVDAYPLSSLYFVSYILIVGLVLINVVVAVLLEKMGGADEDEYEEGDKEDDPSCCSASTSRGRPRAPPRRLPSVSTRRTSASTGSRWSSRSSRPSSPEAARACARARYIVMAGRAAARPIQTLSAPRRVCQR